MRELQRKQNFKKALYSIPSLILLAVLVFFLGKGALKILMVERKSAQTVEDLELEAASLEVREEELKGQIEALNTEEGIMEEIREKFSVTRAGEHVALIVEVKQAESTDDMDESWWSKVWHAIIPPYDN